MLTSHTGGRVPQPSGAVVRRAVPSPVLGGLGEELLELVDDQQDPLGGRFGRESAPGRRHDPVAPRTGSPARSTSAARSCLGRASTGSHRSLPGTTVPFASAGSTPAWISDDLPEPDAYLPGRSVRPVCPSH
nr:hypothetical protein [Streptomyces sp. Ru62]